MWNFGIDLELGIDVFSYYKLNEEFVWSPSPESSKSQGSKKIIHFRIFPISSRVHVKGGRWMISEFAMVAFEGTYGSNNHGSKKNWTIQAMSFFFDSLEGIAK